MIKTNLEGKWKLLRDDGDTLDGHLPGCTYLDYIANGMEDPFWKENETEATKLGHHEFSYSRDFTLNEKSLNKDVVELVIDGAHICYVLVNDKEIAFIDNEFRTWRLDVKDVVKEGKNHIELKFVDPYKEYEKRQSEKPMPLVKVARGQIRVASYHFGWDWGPELYPVGINKLIEIQAYDNRIEETKIIQNHKDNKVELQISSLITGKINDKLKVYLTITSPDGKNEQLEGKIIDNKVSFTYVVNNPKLWWCNGLGEQPLYNVSITLFEDEELVDIDSKNIGLRTITLDTSKDKYGEQFRFIVNGVPIFARGADWIPAEVFMSRATKERLDYDLKAAYESNMNMIRVWGGGFYESEEFYDLCDKYGILVWQDATFCCNFYPLYDEDFLANVKEEINDNVKRIRHRASLAIWSANNENEAFLMVCKDEMLKDSNKVFYYRTLRDWINKLDDVTPYWPGCPSSGHEDVRVHNMHKGKACGDTHLWHVWHGTMPIEKFRDLRTRFCTEFGMESMPSMKAIRSFNDNEKPSLFDSTMLLHQKSPIGNDKMLYYLLAKYREPVEFEDFVYLSQIVQANTVRFATDTWRRHFGEQNGSIFWQINDCWPVASWAGIDYSHQLKAVMYHAKHFNKPLVLSNDYYNNRAEIYIENEFPEDFKGKLVWVVKDFVGNKINDGEIEVNIPKSTSINAIVLKFSKILKGHSKKDAYIDVRLLVNDKEVDRKTWILVPDKYSKLPKVEIVKNVSIKDNVATLTLSSNKYARYVYLEHDNINAPWSDNFFDIMPNEDCVVTVSVPSGLSEKEMLDGLKIKSLTDLKPKNSIAFEKWYRFKVDINPKIIATKIIFKLLLS